MRKRWTGALIAAILTLAACGGDDEAPAENSAPAEPVDNVVSVVAGEYAYSMPTEVEGGVVSLELVNEGDEPHEFAFGRIEEGGDVEAVIESMRKREEDGSEDLAGVPVLSPGATVTMVRELEPGTYFFLCAFPDADFTPHMEHGMYTSFEVTGDAGAELPAADVTIEATDEGFEIPELAEGQQVIEFRNSGTEEHEFVLARRAEPKAAMKDFERWIGKGQQGDSPLYFPGGLQTIPPGTSVIQILNLDAGDYLIEDFGNKLEADFTVR